MAFEVEFSKRLDLFGAEIFAALNDKKVALEAQGKKLYNLSVGTPDFEPMPHIKQALCDAAMVSENWKYSLRDLPELLDTVCAYYKRRFDVDGITPDQIMSFNGSQDGMGHMGLALLNDGDVVLLPDPCYPVFITGVKLGGGVPYYYHLTKEHNFLPNVKEIPDDVADKAKMMIVSLPANPVGSVGSPELYQEIVDFCNAHKILLIHDNAYSDIIFDGAVGRSIFNIPECHFKQENGIQAEVTIEQGGASRAITTMGNGRLDAVSNAIKTYFGITYELSVYEEHAISRGSNSKAATYVGIVHDGKFYWGVGVDEDIIKSSIAALVSAVNKLAAEQHITSGREERIVEIISFIQKNYVDVTLDMLVDTFHLSKPYLSKYIKEKAGMTFQEVVREERMKKARMLLKETNQTVETIAANVGYENVEHFNRLFKKAYDMTPVQYRKQSAE